jgi:acetyl-CoA carboxylase alpha subunit
MAERLKTTLLEYLDQLDRVDTDTLLEYRMRRIANYGVFKEG